MNNNSTSAVANSSLTEDDLYPPELLLPISVVYVVIFFTGVVGNVSTCIVIARNKSMHTATNFYLFSLAISDLLLLVSGLPQEMYRIWSPGSYVFGEAFCILQSFAAETSANATVLTITAFTVERYVAICHPFLSHTMSKLSRAIRFIIAIWILALCLAAPQAMQFGVQYLEMPEGQIPSMCTLVTEGLFAHAFEISTFLFFAIPMTLITVLYVLIAVQLRKSRLLSMKRREVGHGSPGQQSMENRSSRTTAAQNRVVKMLVAVVVAFFLCWAPFHGQRLLAVYLQSASEETQETWKGFYILLLYASGILYYLSTTINPVLYNIMSNKFRDAFKNTLKQLFNKNINTAQNRSAMYSMLSRAQPSLKTRHLSASEASTQISLHFTTNGHRTSGRTSRLVTNGEKTTVLSHNVEVLKQPQRKKRSETITDRSIGNFAQKMIRVIKNKEKNSEKHIIRQTSAGSANTISNSSLQDMDEIEFNSSDLVKCMEEINGDLT